MAAPIYTNGHTVYMSNYSIVKFRTLGFPYIIRMLSAERNNSSAKYESPTKRQYHRPTVKHVG